jgi:hypothetical protein
MNYAVRFVPVEVMPVGHDWVTCRDEQAEVATLYVREGCADMEHVLEDAWAGYRSATASDDLAMVTY